MIQFIDGYPENVLAVTASGVVSDEDYKKTLIPAAEAKIRQHGRISVLYQLGPMFEGFAAKAMVDDAAFGFKHRKEFERVALVTDVEWIKRAVRMLRFMVPCPITIYENADLDKARTWVCSKE
jgi:hypothetical protein